MFEDGIITEIDPKGKVKVKFPALDDLISDWLSVLMPFTFEDKSYFIPAVGSLVTCIMDENFEDGRVIGSIYSEADPPPVEDVNKFVKLFSDGTKLEYDKATHELYADVKGSAEIVASNTIELNCPNVTINSLNTNINSSNVSITGAIALTGSLSATGNISSGGINLLGHVHRGDSGGMTGGAENG